MSDSNSNPSSRSNKVTKAAGLTAVACSLAMFGSLSGLSAANAATPPVGLGTAESFSVLAGSAVTNVGVTNLQGNLGVSPGTAITGFPPGIVGGTTHSADAEALQAQSDLTTAYNDVAGRAATASVSGDLVGQTLVDGVYKADSTLDLSGTLTLDGQGDPSSVFVFQVGSALTTASASNINLINGASACNVYWQVGSSATLGTDSNFVGNLMALTSVSVTTGADIQGRVLARNGQVSLDTNVITNPVCATAVTPDPTPDPVVTPAPSVSPGPGAGPGPVLVGPRPGEGPVLDPTAPTAPTAPTDGTPVDGSNPDPVAGGGTNDGDGTINLETGTGTDTTTDSETQAAVPVGGDGSGTTQLANTGANLSLVGVAAALLALGAALIVAPALQRIRSKH